MGPFLFGENYDGKTEGRVSGSVQDSTNLRTQAPEGFLQVPEGVRLNEAASNPP